MVRAVKSDGEVGISYMKSVEIEEKIREEIQQIIQEELGFDDEKARKAMAEIC